MHIRVLFIVTILALSACDNPDKAWQMAQRDDTPDAYLQFLARYPDSKQAGPARARLEGLKEVRAWERAEFKDNEDTYRAFLEKFPAGEYATKAKNRITGLKRDNAWAIAQEAESKEVVAAFLRDYPDAPQTEQARDLILELEQLEKPPRPTERPGDFRLQLAAFRTAQGAEKELRRLVALFPDQLLGPERIQTPVNGAESQWFLLKTVPMARDEAQTLCEMLKRRGQDCMIVSR